MRRTLEGGVLRKPMGSFRRRDSTRLNGRFLGTNPGIVKTLDGLKTTVGFGGSL